MDQVKISVRGLVEFILRHGDIDNRRTVAGEDAMLAGGKLHRKIQSGMGIGYKAEVPLKYEFETKYAKVCIDGRADGIFMIGENICVDEIKGTYRKLENIREPEPLHLAQAECYAAMLILNGSLSECIGNKIFIRITYANLDSEEIKYIQFPYSPEEILNRFRNLCSEYSKWVDLKAEFKQVRQESIKHLEFPYPYRKGQKELVGHVYRTIYHGRKLFIEAPTGTGKTLSVLFPAVRSVGEGRGDRIFYLTARTIARTVAEEAMELLKAHGLKARNLTLTSKERICFQEEAECNPDACPYAKGHFDRINRCLYELVTSENSFTRDIIEKYAEKYQVCPFELSLDASLFADCIICDYNYVFDPNAYLRRFFGDDKSGDYLFLVDEAHNLVDRGREMYSAVLIKEDLLETKRACRVSLPKIASAIDRCNNDMLALKRRGDNGLSIVSEGDISSLIGHTERLSVCISDYLAEHTEGQGHKEVLDLYFKINDLLNIYDLMGDDYISYTDYDSQGNFFLKLFNVDPSDNLARCMTRARSVILFSATFLPIKYYKSLLGGRDEDYEVYADSIFDPSNQLMLQATDVSSRYSSRSAEQYIKTAEYIKRLAESRTGNYLVFAPSYSYMEMVYEAYMVNFYDEENEEVICQKFRMDEQSKEEFLRRFRGTKDTSPETAEKTGEMTATERTMAQLIDAEIELEDRSLIGFCVMGGIFSEGIDLKNDALIGVAVIGTGLPQIGGERDLLRDYFDDRGLDGFDYAYRFPGMNRVCQAAGRLIRTETDRGVVMLLDHRYGSFANRRLLPKEWQNIITVDINSVAGKLTEFWET